MPDRTPRLPRYRHYKPKDLGVVRLSGRDVYLGKYNSPESLERYRRVVAEWLTTGGVDSRPSSAASAENRGPTVEEMILGYWRHAETYYKTPAGETSQELANVKDALKLLRRLYGRTPAHAFGPLRLRAVRDEMIRAGLARTTVNARIHRIHRCFRWAASYELVPGSLVHDLDTVTSLERGRSQARETDEVKPVPIERVEAVLPFCSRPVAAMVQIQLLTGCRVSEVMRMRGRDLVPGEPNWEYRPGSHKNSWRGHKRVIPLGSKAREIIQAFLKPDLAAYLFDPREAYKARQAKNAGTRKRKAHLYPGCPKRRMHAKERAPLDHYDRRTYRQAIVRACDKAFSHPTLSRLRHKDLIADQRVELRAWKREQRWYPLQLRHTAATLIRARFGLEAASNVLSHSKPETTLLYAERDLARAHQIASEIG